MSKGSEGNVLSIRVLIVTTASDWHGVARLPHALQQAGFEVGALCPEKAFLTNTRFLDHVSPYRRPLSGRVLLKAMEDTVESWRPALLIPGDDRVVVFWHSVVRRGSARDLPEPLRRLIASSMGDPTYYAATINKSVTHHLAAEAGVRVPRQAAVRTLIDALAFARSNGYPVVLKSDLGWGGVGVRVCATEAELLRAFQQLVKRPLVRAILASGRRRARRLLEGGLAADPFFANSSTSIQQFIVGVPVMRTLVAYQGEVLAGLTAIKERVHPAPNGPSAVVRLQHQSEIAETARVLVSRMNFTGFASFDFMLEAASGQAYLIECNPRPTPISHLGSRIGEDLCAALFARLAGKPPPSRPGRFSEDLVALFPQEWLRDPASPYLAEAFHDVPWNDPGLIKTVIDRLV